MPTHYIKKSEGPIFKGDDVEMCIKSMERYFKINKITNEDRLDQVMTYLEGP